MPVPHLTPCTVVAGGWASWGLGSCGSLGYAKERREWVHPVVQGRQSTSLQEGTKPEQLGAQWECWEQGTCGLRTLDMGAGSGHIRVHWSTGASTWGLEELEISTRAVVRWGWISRDIRDTDPVWETPAGSAGAVKLPILEIPLQISREKGDR